MKHDLVFQSWKQWGEKGYEQESSQNQETAAHPSDALESKGQPMLSPLYVYI